jgi:signal transduction histidine kinase
MSFATLSPPSARSDLASVLQTYNDVTERLMRSHDMLGREVCRLREELREKDLELQRRERLAALGEMAAGMAHEIRNPLAAIQLYATLLEKDVDDHPALLDPVRRICSGIRSLEGVVSDILAFAGDARIRPRRVRLGSLLEAALAHARHRVESKAAIVDVDPELYDLQLFCDAGQVERALLNLLLNGLDAIGLGGHVWIRRDAGAGEEWTALVIEDDGPGIDSALLQKIFHPFFSTKDSGTGLGLAIVHGIADMHGGRISAGHRPGGGALFTFCLPAAPRDDQTNTEE